MNLSMTEILDGAATREAAYAQRWGRVTNPYDLSNETELKWFNNAWNQFEGTGKARAVRVGKSEVELWRAK